MAVFTKKTLENGKVQYRNATENKIVAKDSLDELLIAKLENVPEGVKVPEDANIDDKGVDAPEIEEGVRSRTITLKHPLLVNGKTFPGGRPIEVPESQADDLLRIDSDHTDYENNLIRRQDFSSDAPRPQDIQ